MAILCPVFVVVRK